MCGVQELPVNSGNWTLHESCRMKQIFRITLQALALSTAGGMSAWRQLGYYED